MAGEKSIPYNRSKLTTVLKDSLGGGCYTSLVATVSPAQKHAHETFATLKFAASCSKVSHAAALPTARKRVRARVHVAGARCVANVRMTRLERVCLLAVCGLRQVRARYEHACSILYTRDGYSVRPVCSVLPCTLTTPTPPPLATTHARTHTHTHTYTHTHTHTNV